MRLLLPMAILSLAVVALACADDGDDHDEAYRLREQREILPLEELLRRLDLGEDTRILEIESEFEHGRYVYEIEYLDHRGRIHEVLIDARSGEVLAEEKGH